MEVETSLATGLKVILLICTWVVRSIRSCADLAFQNS